MAYLAGDVILVPFPFRDQLAERVRPAVVVSCAQYNHLHDLVVAAVTSHPPRNPFDLQLQDWAGAGLKIPSTVRMLLATIAADRVVLSIGHLTNSDWQEVQKRMGQLFAWP